MEERETAAYEEAFGRFVRGGTDHCTAEQRQLLLANRTENRAAGVGTPSAGGYLVPPGYRALMTETLKAFGGLINYANVITTSTGNPLPVADQRRHRQRRRDPRREHADQPSRTS